MDFLMNAAKIAQEVQGKKKRGRGEGEALAAEEEVLAT